RGWRQLAGVVRAVAVPGVRRCGCEVMRAVSAAPGGVNTVRRVISYLLLGVMVLIAGIGLAGLIERIVTAPELLGEFGSGGLAQSLAFTLIAGPFAAGLWWFSWRNLTDASADRHSV